MLLKQILKKIDYLEIIGKGLNQNIENASSDSRLIFNKSIFIIRKGKKFNSLDFIPQIKDKVSCFLASFKDKQAILDYSKRYKDKVFILVKDLDEICEILSSELFKSIEKLNIIGVTGTNGKTTTSFLIDKILNEQGASSALLGTVYYRWKNNKFKSFLTTLDNFMLKSALHKISTDKIGYVVLETSSHALAQERLKGIKLWRAIFTNLSWDHLDFHKNMQNYFKAKFKIFKHLKNQGKAIINIDDKYGYSAYRKFRGNKLSFGVEKRAFYKIKSYRFDKGRVEFIINLRGRDWFIKSPLLGKFNLYNLLASLSCCDSLGLDLKKVVNSISSFKGPEGRLEEVKKGIFVDYAHSPSALREAILALREAKFKKVIVVFGCGGDRDKLKRPKMGKIASLYADYSIITSDNPRSEESFKICQDIEKGITGKNYQIIIDRKEAIQKAIKLKKDSFTSVLIAGKGHESYQIFKDRIIKFNDRKVVNQLTTGE